MRVHDNGNVYFVTNRCHQERFFMLPRPGVNKIIGAWFSRALHKYGDGIEIFAVIFLSNHFHILLRDTKGQMAEFMWYMQLNIAKALNEFNGKRKGEFFSREYDAVPVLTDEDFLDRYAYTVTNAVKSKLVERASEGPFFNSLKSARSETSMQFRWLNRTLLNDKTRRNQEVDKSEFETKYEIEFTVPPMWQGLSKPERKSVLDALVKGSETKYAKERKSEKQTVLGVERMLKQRWWGRPKNPSRRPRVKVFCRIKEMKEEYLETLRTTVGYYREMFDGYSKASLRGRRAVLEWPPGSYPPSMMRPVGAEA